MTAENRNELSMERNGMQFVHITVAVRTQDTTQGTQGTTHGTRHNIRL